MMKRELSSVADARVELISDEKYEGDLCRWMVAHW
jgi:hypothetical protein